MHSKNVWSSAGISIEKLNLNLVVGFFFFFVLIRSHLCKISFMCSNFFFGVCHEPKLTHKFEVGVSERKMY